ncbi:hypothetical protein [uncultured Mailhella sp.]|uniref:hypothetical protein n=1 Tax=uncultured Mailhella sp. TaxID=1981031 RepID=UPI0026033593|nr:hypothetical protein [uncultured Mailhella sp.]
MSGYSTAIMLTATALSTAVGVGSAIQQGKVQKQQAEYQSAVARQNQQLAEQQADAERRQGYENMVTKRQETAKLIGRQRAAAGASGAAVDEGSNLDLQADTAAQGEMDAINAYNQGLDRAYNSEIQAQNYGNQASAFDMQGQNSERAGYLNAASAAVGGIADMGSTWAKGLGTQKKTGYWDRALQQTVSKPPRH